MFRLKVLDMVMNDVRQVHKHTLYSPRNLKFGCKSDTKVSHIVKTSVNRLKENYYT